MTSMFWTAVRKGDVPEAERLLRQDPSLLEAREIFNDHRGTPLMRASEAGQVKMVHWLLEKGAAVNTRDRYGAKRVRPAALSW
jgi:ankyrin repeat protein